MENEIIIDNSQRLVISHTSIPRPKINILLDAKRLKEISKQIGSDAVFIRIEVWEDVESECENIKYYQRIKIIKKS